MLALPYLVAAGLVQRVSTLHSSLELRRAGGDENGSHGRHPTPQAYHATLAAVPMPDPIERGQSPHAVPRIVTRPLHHAYGWLTSSLR